MTRIWIVGQKEVWQILKNRSTLASGFLFTLVFGGLSVPAAVTQDSGGILLDRLGFFVMLVLGVFMGYIFSGQAFLREKQTGVIETVLCAPLSLRELWLGKVVGVTAVAYGMTLVTAVVIYGSAAIVSHGTIILSAPVIVHLFTGIPAFIAAAVGLLGFGQLMLGMRENQFLNIGLLFLVIFLITGVQGFVGPEFQGSWSLAAGFFGLALSLFLITSSLTRFLNKERVVLTIP